MSFKSLLKVAELESNNHVQLTISNLQAEGRQSLQLLTREARTALDRVSSFSG